ncbi:MAG: PAS domain-containing protein [Kofleriaceae bacterium]|nr:PAS domain-containing protein [Kofleriaceae bacterium]MBP6837240.1 PAS domain-containing protein [Kofleriaceae bacterium]MBP9206078.1 PAS domain-containing protein [Kofleriaceae bacterium]
MTAPEPGLDLDAAAAVLLLARDLHLDLDEPTLVSRVLDALARLEPGCALAVRVGGLRGGEAVRCYARHGVLRGGLERERLAVSAEAALAAALKPAVGSSARLRLGARWDSPFVGAGAGFSVPLASGGELFGIIDVADPPAAAPRAMPMPARAARLWPVANQLAAVVRSVGAEREVRDLRDYQARLIDQADALVLAVDRRSRVTAANRALLTLLGRRRDDVVGRDLRELVPDDQRQHVATAFAAGLAGEHRLGVEIVLAAADRRRVRTVWNVSALGEPAEPAVGEAAAGPGAAIGAVVAVGADQSRLAELEAQMVRAERLGTLGKLAAGVVHELNNPLTSITVYADYLLRKLDGRAEAGDLEKLRRIGASAQRIQRFARDLVQYGRPAATSVEPVDVNDVVGQSLAICEHLFERAQIVTAAELAPALPTVLAVPGQLEQVLINLVTNAAHAVEEAGGTIRVRTVRLPAAIEVEVADSGPGVPELERERIFEPFFTTKPDGKGTGLGLPIVRNIVEQHRGTITVGSSDLGGAAFVVRLPLA